MPLGRGVTGGPSEEVTAEQSLDLCFSRWAEGRGTVLQEVSCLGLGGDKRKMAFWWTGPKSEHLLGHMGGHPQDPAQEARAKESIGG